MPTDLVIAGLCEAAFDAVRKVSSKRFAPVGELFVSPVKWPSYPPGHEGHYLDAMRDRILSLSEDEKMRCTIAYVDYGDSGTTRFIDAFFPFALKRPIKPLDLTTINGEAGRRRETAKYIEYLLREAQELRSRAAVVSEYTHLHNLTPLLLPRGNFSSHHYISIMQRLWKTVGVTPDIATIINTAKNDFYNYHPKVQAPGDEQACLSDGMLYFRSPGRHRHGFYRHQAGQGHRSDCLLNARSRLGGSYSHAFHYDCLPVRKLAKTYPNCHGALVEPNKNHINIAPNDAVI